LRCVARCGLHVVVEVVLHRDGAQAHGVDLVLALVADPGLDEVAGKHVTLEEKLVVGLEGVEGLGERARDVGDGGELFG
jgi:hypothetical protein